MLRSPAALQVETPGQMHPLRAALLFTAAGLAALAVPFVEHPLIYALVGAMLLAYAAPLWISWQRGRFDAFESFNVLGALYFVFFGLGAIWVVDDPGRIAYDWHILPYLPKATFYCVLGLLAMILGYNGPWFRRLGPRNHEEMPTGALFLLGPAALGFVGFAAAALWSWASWAGESISGMISSLGQLWPLFVFSWGLAWMLMLSGRATRPQRLLFWLVLIPMALFIVSGRMTTKALPVMLAGTPLIAFWYVKRRLPWKTLIALVLLLIFVIFPFYNTFRLLDPRASQGQRLQMTQEVIGGWDRAEYLDRSLGTFKFRLALINSVAVVMRDVGRWVPYAKGDTLFLPTLAFFVPRLLWPEKPSFLLGRQFAHTFRVVNMVDRQTSIAATMPGELYWNFDLPGILIGMALYGALVRFFYRRYGEATALDPVRRAMHVIVLIEFAHFGGGIAGHIVTLLRTVVLLEVYFAICRHFGLLRRHPVSPPLAAVERPV